MYTIDFLVAHVDKAINDAYENKSKLSVDVLEMDGMSGKKTRHLYNNICTLNDVHYLEIGTWKGSSFISALYGNNIQATSIDNSSEGENVSAILYANVLKYLKPNIDSISLLTKDSWSIQDSDIKRNIDIYMYDGAHTYEAQKKAITYYHKYFSKYVIIMVDDWECDWVKVREGTLDGINEMNMKVHYSKEIGLVNTTEHHKGGDTFWNGCGVFVCERTDI